MASGSSPAVAAKLALSRITTSYPEFNGALVVVAMDGTHGELVFIMFRRYSMQIVPFYLAIILLFSQNRNPSMPQNS